MTRWAQILVGLALVALAGCGGKSHERGVDAGADAGGDGDVDADCDGDRDAGGSTAHLYGALALLGMDLRLGIADDFEVCVLGRPDLACATAGASGLYDLDVPTNAEIALRVHRDGFIDWIKPLHTATADLSAFAIFMPRPDFTDAILTSVGGFRTDQAYALTYVERPDELNLASLEDRGAPGYRVTASEGEVHYVAADFTHLDDAATATTGSGVAIITGIPAPTFAADAAPGCVRVTLAPPEGEELCSEPQIDNIWSRGLSPLEVQAPVFQGHFTYALFLTCPPE